MNAPRAGSQQGNNPFHTGEQAVHERFGISERMRAVGQRVIRTDMPAQHQQFYSQLPMVLAGSIDGGGRPWASVLVGQPGFMHARDAQTLDIKALPIPGDPLADGIRVGAPLGLLGIELHTRRRNRANGRVIGVSDEGFQVDVEQTIGNCPQYIQRREISWVRDASEQRPRAVERLEQLNDSARELIAHADTLFVATHAPADEEDAARGADVSHRGGRAGFVRIEDERTLLVPDFSGNSMFMTLGNLLVNPRAGVLFIDFKTGDLLTLTGSAEVIWDSDEIKKFQGAERAWRFRIESAWHLRDALPLRWTFRDWSPTSLGTGSWAGQDERR